MELKLLQGGSFANSEERVADDELFNEVLDKFSVDSSSEKNTKVLHRDPAKDAMQEILERKKHLDTWAALDVIKKNFDELWSSHDVTSKGFIDTTEGYTFLQEVAKE